MNKIIKYVRLLVLIPLLSLSAAPLKADEVFDQPIMEIGAGNLLISPSLKGIRLFHDEEGFFIVRNGFEIAVKTEWIDKRLRHLSHEELSFLLGLKVKIRAGTKEHIFTKISAEQAETLMDKGFHAYHLIQLSDEDKEKIISQLAKPICIEIFQSREGQYGLRLKMRLCGGGVWGSMAGAYAGKFITHFVCHGTIFIIGACTGAAAPVTIASLEATFLPTIEALSTAIALAGGIAGGVATGPV